MTASFVVEVPDVDIRHCADCTASSMTWGSASGAARLNAALNPYPLSAQASAGQSDAIIISKNGLIAMHKARWERASLPLNIVNRGSRLQAPPVPQMKAVA